MRKEMFDEDMLAVLDQIGEDITVNGITVKAVCGEISDGIAQELAGYLPDVTAGFVCRLIDFGDTPPKAQNTVVYGGKNYRILVPTASSGGRSIRLDCGAY